MKIVLYRDKQKQFRWRLVAKNGRILADCSEGYKEKRKMIHTVKNILFRFQFFVAPVVDKTGKK